MCRPPFNELEQLFRISELDNILNAETLNLLKSKIEKSGVFDFVSQFDFAESDLYYEEIIYKRAQIPTRRESWHDLFNGLIWLQFPKTKALLNRWHMEDIQAHGLNPRTPRRNLVTHFDECGVIIVTDDLNLIDDLREHLFKSTLFDHREKWGHNIQATLFGHANYEMLMEPYIGLTGKWLPIMPCEGYFDMPRAEQLCFIDKSLCQQLIVNSSFCQSTELSPLPLLGIPGWWPQNCHSEFYSNTGYFRPKPTKRPSKLRNRPEEDRVPIK